jgi:hypothetical protein
MLLGNTHSLPADAVEVDNAGAGGVDAGEEALR